LHDIQKNGKGIKKIGSNNSSFIRQPTRQEKTIDTKRLYPDFPRQITSGSKKTTEMNFWLSNIEDWEGIKNFSEKKRRECQKPHQSDKLLGKNPISKNKRSREPSNKTKKIEIYKQKRFLQLGKLLKYPYSKSNVVSNYVKLGLLNYEDLKKKYYQDSSRKMENFKNWNYFSIYNLNISMKEMKKKNPGNFIVTEKITSTENSPINKTVENIFWSQSKNKEETTEKELFSNFFLKNTISNPLRSLGVGTNLDLEMYRKNNYFTISNHYKFKIGFLKIKLTNSMLVPRFNPCGDNFLYVLKLK